MNLLHEFHEVKGAIEEACEETCDMDCKACAFSSNEDGSCLRIVIYDMVNNDCNGSEV